MFRENSERMSTLCLYNKACNGETLTFLVWLAVSVELCADNNKVTGAVDVNDAAQLAPPS